MTKHTTITVDARRYEDSDDCLAAAAEDIAAERGLEGYDLEPRWDGENREHIALTIPLWAVTRDELFALRSEAASAGDDEQVAICDRALAGNTDARAECGRVIDAARAME